MIRINWSQKYTFHLQPCLCTPGDALERRAGAQRKGEAVEEARPVPINCLLHGTCRETPPPCWDIHTVLPSLWAIASWKDIPYFHGMLQKWSSMESWSNNLLKEFHPSRKRVKLLPPGFVFIPVINQIPKESWKKFKGKKKASSSFAVSSLWLPGGFSLHFSLSKMFCWMFLPFVIIFSNISYIGTVVCTYVCIYMHTCMDCVPGSSHPLSVILHHSLTGVFLFWSTNPLDLWGTISVQTRVAMAEVFQN